ncbi:MAG: hypothetical protein OHK0039_12730 [Bacteroidia bacterium]
MYLHVVSFDVPDPPTYGGVIDVFWRIRALTDAGARVILHAFDYGRGPSEHLEAICERVYYYPRKSILRSLPVSYPHIVKSRASDELLVNLLLDDIPILFEGLHTTWFLAHPELASRIKLVRLHNIEWEYYYQLAQRESRYWHKQYYLAESRLLKSWEELLVHADHLLTISPKDTRYYQETFGQVTYLPAFHPYDKLSVTTGKGDFCLYHGNLSVAENHEAALFLIHEVFEQMPDIPLMIAGADPFPELIELASRYDHILLRPNPGQGEMEDFLHHAQIHVLPTFQATGIKLKLINSLYTGRFVIANAAMIHETGLEFCVERAQTSEEFQEVIQRLFPLHYTEADLARRKICLGKTFDNAANATRLLELIRNT